MKKVYSFTQSVMNGTVTMETSVALFSTRELAEQTLADINADYRLDLVPLEIDFEHGPGYWEVKYRQLKSRIEKLISEKGE